MYLGVELRNISLLFVKIVLATGMVNKILLNKLLAMVVKRFPRVIVLIPVFILFTSSLLLQIRTADQNENYLNLAMIIIGFVFLGTRAESKS